MKLILNYFPNLSPLQRESFSKLKNIYGKWNQKINLLSRKSFEEFYLQHVLHSLSIAKIIDFLPGSQLMDLGTGGGFPGIPLALLFPESNFLLIDSINKKIKALDEIIKELEIKNVRSICQRAESIDQRFDFILTRGLAPLETIYKWSENKIKKENKHNLPNGLLCLKGGDLSKELKNFPDAKLIEIKNFFKEDFFESKKIVYLKT